MMLDAGHGLLSAVESVMKKVFLPSLRGLEKGWGVLDEAKNQQAKADFINSLTSFTAVLAGKVSFLWAQHSRDCTLPDNPDPNPSPAW